MFTITSLQVRLGCPPMETPCQQLSFNSRQRSSISRTRHLIGARTLIDHTSIIALNQARRQRNQMNTSPLHRAKWPESMLTLRQVCSYLKGPIPFFGAAIFFNALQTKSGPAAEPYKAEPKFLARRLAFSQTPPHLFTLVHPNRTKWTFSISPFCFCFRKILSRLSISARAYR